MQATDSRLFEPLAIGGHTIRGRLIKTATSETLATADGHATDAHVAFYEPMARGGTPLIITGNIYTSRDGQSTPRQMGIDADDKIPGLARMTDAVHRHGSAIYAQLSHCGRQVLPPFVGLDVALSASTVKDLSTGTRPRALTSDEIAGIVGDFASAARRCREAGFDGVQIHAGHGYLISQFLTPHTNRRDDRYGGSLENRVRLLREILAAIRREVGAAFPVIMKLNGDDALPLRAGLVAPELVAIARIMEGDGIDAVEVSVGHYESGFPVVRGTFGRCLRGMVRGSARHLPAWRRHLFRFGWPLAAVVFNLLWPHRQGFNLASARHFKAALGIPVICVGGFVTRDAMDAALSQGTCDAVSAGRAFIADPFLFRHLRDGQSGPRCVFCNACVGTIGSGSLDCLHPRVGRQKQEMLAAAQTPAPAPPRG